MLAFGSLGPWEIIIVLLVVLLVFGRRLPEVARSLGKGIFEFRKGLKEGEEDLKQDRTEGTNSGGVHNRGEGAEPRT